MIVFAPKVKVRLHDTVPAPLHVPVPIIVIVLPAPEIFEVTIKFFVTVILLVAIARTVVAVKLPSRVMAFVSVSVTELRTIVILYQCILAVGVFSVQLALTVRVEELVELSIVPATYVIVPFLYARFVPIVIVPAEFKSILFNIIVAELTLDKVPPPTTILVVPVVEDEPLENPPLQVIILPCVASV